MTQNVHGKRTLKSKMAAIPYMLSAVVEKTYAIRRNPQYLLAGAVTKH